MTLAQIQRLFWEAARKQASPEALQDCFSGDLRLSGPQRMGIYASAFFVRQLAALSTFLPKTEHLLQDDFHRLGRQYILEFPGTDAAIESFPARFADFLETFPAYRGVAALARLELARNRALLAPEDSGILSPEEFQKLTPTSRLRAARHAVVVGTTREAFQLFDAGVGSPGEVKGDMPAGSPVTLLFFRKEFGVRHRVVARDEALAVDLLGRGATLSSLCGVFVKHEEPLGRVHDVLSQLLRCKVLLAEPGGVAMHRTTKTLLAPLAGFSNTPKQVSGS